MFDFVVDAVGHRSAQKAMEKVAQISDSKKRDDLLFHALMDYIQGSNKKGVAQAIKAGADVNRKTLHGVAPLQLAEDAEIAMMLLKANADIIYLDANRNLLPEEKVEIRKAYREYLKSHGLNQKKEYSKPDGKTQAMLDFDEAPDFITYKTLELLAKKTMKKAASESNPEKRQHLLQDVLLYSMEISDLAGMEKAVQAGADVNLKNKGGYNALMIAPSPKTALFILENGGKLDDLDFAFRLKPIYKMVVREEFERRSQEKQSATTLLRKDSREI